MEENTGEIVTEDVVEDVDEVVEDEKVEITDDKKTTPEPKKEAPAKSLEEQFEELQVYSRRHETNSRTNLKKYKETQELLDATLKEKEELAAQLETFKTEAKTATRQTIALKYGLSPVLASRLQGETLEELEADAVLVVQDLGDKVKKPNTVQGLLNEKLENAPSQFQQAQQQKFS